MSSRRRGTALVTLGAAFVLSTAACAAEKDEVAPNPQFNRRSEPRRPAPCRAVAAKPGEKACFRRVYDPAHLARHPGQKITAADFVLSFVELKPGYFSDGPQSKKTLYRYEFSMSARLRGEPKTLYTAGACEPMDAFVPDPKTGEAKPGTRRPAIFCTVEEDGGAVAIAKAADSDAMMLRFEPPLDRLRMTRKGGSSESDGVEIEPGPEDRAYRLERTDAATCRAIAREIAKAW